MKCFSWIESAVQARESPDCCTSKDSRKYHEKNIDTARENIDGRRIGYTKPIEMTVPQTWTDEPPLELHFGDRNKPSETVMGFWDDEESNGKPLEPLIEHHGGRAISSTDIPVRKSSRPSNLRRNPSGKEGLHDSSLALDYNPAVVAFVSSGRTRQPKTLNRRGRSSISTIYLNSPLAPVTIIVTTPDNDSESETSSPTTNTFDGVRADHIGSPLIPSITSEVSFPIPSPSARMSTDSLFVPDTSRLMPPTERQIDTRRLRKAREFREVRKFLIDFLNTKSDQFPKKLRCRMLDLYSITEADLDPAIVKKFLVLDGEGRDEGVALEQNEDGSDADDLRILAMAFRSQIPIVTPKEPAPRRGRGSREMVIQTAPSLGVGAIRRRITGVINRPATVTEGEELPFPALPESVDENKTESTPLRQPWADIKGEEIASPTKAHFGTLKKEMHRLHKTMSEPNIYRPSVEARSLPFTSQRSMIGGKGRNKSLPSGAEAKRVFRQMTVIDEPSLGGPKRSNLITGTLGNFFGAKNSRTESRAEQLKEMEKLRFLNDVS